MTRRRALLAAGGALGWATAVAPACAHSLRDWPPGKKVPPLRLPRLGGGEWDLAAQRGRPLLINFWASWCEPCRAEMPSLQALQAQLGDELVVLAVNYKESPEAVQRFVQRQGWTLPVITDPQGLLAKRWGIRIFPTSVLIDAQAKPVSMVRGEVDWQLQAGSPWLQGWLSAGN